MKSGREERPGGKKGLTCPHISHPGLHSACPELEIHSPSLGSSKGHCSSYMSPWCRALKLGHIHPGVHSNTLLNPLQTQRLIAQVQSKPVCLRKSCATSLFPVMTRVLPRELVQLSTADLFLCHGLTPVCN